MMEWHVAVCDDLEEERASLARMVRASFQRRELPIRISLFSSGEELLGAYRQWGQFHILFLDIYMPGTSGVEAARQIRAIDEGVALLFVTTSQDHGLDSFEVQASDYLVKPVRAEDVDRALDWCIRNMPESLRCLTVSVEGEEQEIPLYDIRSIEVLGHSCHIHTSGREVVVRRGLDVLEEEIDSRDFLRCHRSFLVNLEHVQGIEGSDFRMRDGTLVPISLGNLNRVRERFLDWSFIKAWERR